MKTAWMLLLAITWSATSSADSLRCGRSLVKTGDSTNVLLNRCGAPLRKYSGKAILTTNHRPARVSVSNWVYRRPGKKDMIVSVREGAVVNIAVDRGH